MKITFALLTLTLLLGNGLMAQDASNIPPAAGAAKSLDRGLLNDDDIAALKTEATNEKNGEYVKLMLNFGPTELDPKKDLSLIKKYARSGKSRFA